MCLGHIRASHDDIGHLPQLPLLRSEHDLARLIDSLRTPFTVSEVKCLMQQLLRHATRSHAYPWHMRTCLTQLH